MPKERRWMGKGDDAKPGASTILVSVPAESGMEARHPHRLCSPRLSFNGLPVFGFTSKRGKLLLEMSTRDAVAFLFRSSRGLSTAHFPMGLHPKGFPVSRRWTLGKSQCDRRRGENPLKHRQRRTALQPMMDAANDDDDDDEIVGLSDWEFLDATVDPGRCNPCFHRRILGRRDHFGFGIESGAASDRRCESNRQQAGSAADVEQGFAAAQPDLLRTTPEKAWRIAVPAAGIAFNGGGEAAHLFQSLRWHFSCRGGRARTAWAVGFAA
jgi:hypothetical protein